MSETKYKEAYQKGFDAGVEAQQMQCVFDCDKDIDDYKKGREDAIEEIKKEIIRLITLMMS